MPIYFQNKGLIDLRSIRTFGVNVKETDNPIGYFGTGLKYAIAIVLRQRGKVHLYRGMEKIEFTTKVETIRGKDFDFVYMGDEALGFTLELGKNWKVWQAYREFHSNTLDEMGSIQAEAIQPNPDTTTFIVSLDEFTTAFHERHNIFLSTPILFKTDDLEVRAGEGHSIYYRGIKVATSPHCYATYNQIKELELTEDRTISAGTLTVMRYHIAEAYMEKCDDPGLLRQVMLAQKGTLETELPFSWHPAKPSELFLDIAEELVSSPQFSRDIHPDIKKLVSKFRKKEFVPDILKLTDIQQKQLERAIEFLNTLGFSPQEHEIVCVETLGLDVMGQAKNKTIFLCRKTFDMGTKQLAGTLLEEHLHLARGIVDETRSMQNTLIDLIITLGEEHVLGEPL